VDAAWVTTFPAPKSEELEMLEFAKSEFRANSRLACQLDITAAHDGLIVRLPDQQ
jgi:2Fe-2S ferredoxin